MLAEIKNNPLITQPVIIKIKPISVDAKSGLITSQGLYIGQVGRFILLKSRYKSSGCEKRTCSCRLLSQQSAYPKTHKMAGILQKSQRWVLHGISQFFQKSSAA